MQRLPYKISFLLISFALLTFGRTAIAADEGLAERISSYIKPLVTSGELSGTLLVARKEKVLFEESFGMANYELNVRNSPSTKFCIASVNKPMTVLIAVRLMEQGKFNEDDLLAKWIPEFPRGQEITVGHLLNHRSGLPHRVTTDGDEATPKTAADMVKLAARAKLLFDPGKQEAYSSAGFSVLSRVLELASGKSYETLLEEIVFKPVEAKDSFHPVGRRLILNRADGYFRGPNGPMLSQPRDLSFLIGAGAVFSTPRDLYKIARGLIEGRYGEKASQAMIRESGLRWNGSTSGYRAFVQYEKSSQLYVIFAGNLFTGAADQIQQAIPKLAAGEKVDPPQVPKVTPVSVGAENRKRIEGTYQLFGGQTEPLEFQSDQWATLGEWILIATGKDTFFSPQDYSNVKVVSGSNDSVALQWGEPGHGPTFNKIGK